MDQIFTGRSRTTQLRAPDDRVKSRAETLAAARQKRQERDDGQRRVQAAGLIQRHYRGFRARKAAARSIIATTEDDAQPTLAWCSRVYGFFKRTSTPRPATTEGGRPRPRRGLWAWVTPLALDCLETSVVRAFARSSPDVVRAANLTPPSIKGFAEMLGRKVQATPGIVSALVIASQTLPGTTDEAECLLHVVRGVGAASDSASADRDAESFATIARALASVLLRAGSRCDLEDAVADAGKSLDAHIAVDVVAQLLQLPVLLGQHHSDTAAADSAQWASDATAAPDALFVATEWRAAAAEQGMSEATAAASITDTLRAFLATLPERAATMDAFGAATLARRLVRMRTSLPVVEHSHHDDEASSGVTTHHRDVFARSVVALLKVAVRHRDAGAALFADILASLRRVDAVSASLSASPASPAPSSSGGSGELAWLVGEGVTRLFEAHGLHEGVDDEAATHGAGSAPVWHLLQELDAVCEAYAFPYSAYISGAYRGAAPTAPSAKPSSSVTATTFTTRRANAVPYVSALAYNTNGFLVQGLWRVLSATTGTWALKDRAGNLVLRFPHVISLFANLCAVHLATGDLAEFAQRVGGTDQLRRLVVVLRETVFLAVWNAPEASTAVAPPPSVVGEPAAASQEQRRVTANFVSAAVQVLDAIYTADLNTRLIPAHEWIAPNVTTPHIGDIVLENLDGPATLAAVAAITQGNPAAEMSGAQAGGAGGADSSSDSDDLADVRHQRLMSSATTRAGRGHGRFLTDQRRDNAGGDASSGASSVVKLAALLRVAPFIVPFATRVVVFSRLLQEERMMQRGAAPGLRVRRHHEFEDAFAELLKTPRAVAHVHDVRFKDDEDREEMGYGQGVLRDFIHAAVESGFGPENGLFTEDRETKTLHILPYANPVPEEGDARPRFAFLGRLLGRAIQDGILVDVPLPGYLRNGLLGRQNGFADLLSYDVGLHRHLSELRAGHYTDAQLEEMELTFTYSEQHLGQTFEVPLAAGGETKRVTRGNALEYCHLLTDYLLNRRCGRQVRALQSGLFEVVPRDRLKIFNAEELQTLIRGQENDIPLDVEDWRAHTNYSRWEASDPGVEVFWAAVRSMAPHEQRAVLKFATSAGRAPLLGFAQLQPAFTLERSGNDEGYLPTAATCMCTLRIPRYSSPEMAKTKLLQGATQCDTFEMS